MTNEETNRLITLERMLAKHDWQYQYSDDHFVWKSGQASQEAIFTEIDALTKLGFSKQANHLFNQAVLKYL